MWTSYTVRLLLKRGITHVIESKIFPVNVSVELPELSVNELNAMRYVAGYVPFKLEKKFAASSQQYKIEFLSCLVLKMATVKTA